MATLASRKLRNHTKELIPGGLASGKSPSDFSKKLLREGREVEMEHTTSPRVATEIAMDHLTEDKKYYQKLRKVEKVASAYAAAGFKKVGTAALLLTLQSAAPTTTDLVGPSFLETESAQKLAEMYGPMAKEAINFASLREGLAAGGKLLSEAITPAAKTLKATPTGLHKELANMNAMKGLVGAPAHGMTPRAGEMLKTPVQQVTGLGNRGRQVGPQVGGGRLSYTTPT